MRAIGRALQLLALVILPLSMMLQFTGTLERPFHVSQMVFMLIFGICAFFIGRLLEGYASR